MILELCLCLGSVEGLMPRVDYLVPVWTAVEQVESDAIGRTADRQPGGRANQSPADTMHGGTSRPHIGTDHGPGDDKASRRFLEGMDA